MNSLGRSKGRPTVLTSERRRHVLRLLSQGTSRNRAARLVGCAPSTITYGALRDPGFASAVRRAKAAHYRRLAHLLDPARNAKSHPQPEPRCETPPHREIPNHEPPRAKPRAMKENTAKPCAPPKQKLTPTAPARSSRPERGSKTLRDEIAADFQRVTGVPLAQAARHIAESLGYRGGPEQNSSGGT